MNYSLLCDIFRKNREYTDLTSALKAPFYGKRKPYYVSGLTTGAENVFLQSLAEDFADTSCPIVLVFADEKRASSFRSFLDSCGTRAAYFPSREYCFSNIASSHDYEGERLSVLSSLAGITTEESRAGVICTTAEAVLQITVSPDVLREKCIKISFDSPLDTEILAQKLTEAGYTRVELVEAVGQFAIRGGIIDVYPPSSEAVRIELFGDEIDRMGYFSTETQRFTETCPDTLVLPPVRELMFSDEKRDELREAVKRHIRRIGHTEEKNARAAEILESELTSIEHGFELNFADKYLPLLYPEGTSFLDYSYGAMVLVDCVSIEDRAHAQAALIEQSVADMTENYELPPMKNGVYLREFEEIGGRQSGAVVFMDTLARSHTGFTPAALFAFNTRHVPAYSGNTALFNEDLSRFRGEGYFCAVLCASENERAALTEAINSAGNSAMQADLSKNDTEIDTDEMLKSKNPPVLVMSGEFPGGYELAYPKFVLLDYSKEASKPSHGRYLKKAKKKKTATEAIMSYADLEVGDIVVHEAYGIGQYMGLETLTIDGASRDYVHIKYAGSDKLFLPVEKLDKVSKYIGARSDDGMVKLSKMGGDAWKKSKARASAAVKEMARELIRLYAERMRLPGHAFPADDRYQKAFEDAFEYEETDSQLATAAEIKRDMTASAPMDRLLCGDVGYGKTEVAMRAAYKAVLGGKQVAVLVPTTLLALQHYQTFVSRMRAFAVNVDMLSRFRTPKQQAATLRRLVRGEVDVLVGTHRLLSQDVRFHDLGLIIVDEEQRFGVAQKEKLKQLTKGVDVLSLSATPIPRTLNMAMGGIRDISILDDAPVDRLPIQTYVLEEDPLILEEAIRRELRRGGQVFYLHNNVETIYSLAAQLASTVPEARITVAHGKMEKDELEKIWEQMLNAEIDILVCTTIIETGVDVPNANTLIVSNADRLGLSQLHQIRGRVGRSSRRAYAYFTFARGKALSEVATKRLEAIREYAEFGAGFKVALRDMEIRGAGNLLGAEQHGHLDAVGYDLYIKLLNQAVLTEKGEAPEQKTDCTVSLNYSASLPERYVPYPAQRMALYKKIALISSVEDLADVTDELVDRYGEPPEETVNLLRVALIHSTACACGVVRLLQDTGGIHIYPERLDIDRWLAVAAQIPQLRMLLSGDAHLCLRLQKGERGLEKLQSCLSAYLETTVQERNHEI